jgi:hypothetical protein
MKEIVAAESTRGQRCMTAECIVSPAPCKKIATNKVARASRLERTLPVKRWAWWNTAVDR